MSFESKDFETEADEAGYITTVDLNKGVIIKETMMDKTAPMVVMMMIGHLFL
jgi:hypothetical protein